jgi:hypothetical protein
MKSRDVVVWRQVVDELANALKVAIGLAQQVRRNAQTTGDDAVLLENSIARAVAVLRRVQPRPPARKRSVRHQSAK